ncbi:MAG TPA: hypothetical protein VNF04_11460, partial [Stellaceae bacterium]|nr:hypothetical protein [Stellaceae bacterium]
MTRSERILCAATAARLSGVPASLGDLLGADGAGFLRVPTPLVALVNKLSGKVPNLPARFCLAIIDQPRDMSHIWPQWASWMLRTIALPAVSVDKWGVRDAVEAAALSFERHSNARAADAAA